ncbi:peptide/nickel transport system ATP-binding protein [Kribbella sp. VKM Ac-2527]|uniref:Peptide/nickel transport system ATP-binding protein n=1 Tax=Kribbella caucasensis TaxID=2512215 RepID=A0A4R6KF66_9ACTN|nr:ABC transporter ATP-binding protein [Kribbella sp. VKM Ac-2527]TDO47398.1 peptide/nickel transport system ATP-binding protein [Kribbella sp. VKM Ac-2527]
MTVVDVRSLTVRVGSRDIVSDVSFSVGAGEIVALVGESGSGKTTTALALLGESPSGAQLTGQVEVAGSTVDSSNSPPAGVVGYIPQHPSAALNPVRRIGPVLREIARLHGGGSPVQQRVLDALRQAQMPDGSRFLRRYPHQLSGGQQQRVVLAHELVGQPKVLIADEPTTGQDAVIRAQLIEELRAVAGQGIAILLLTHDLELVRALADHVLVMHRGSAVESGPCLDVLGTPQHQYTIRLINAAGRNPAAPPPVLEESTPVVSVRRLVAGHRRVDTLHDISLEIRPRDRIAIVGRSGSGKTTLARCIAGLHPFRQGEILLWSTPLSPLLRRRSFSQLARIQYVFQDARASFNEFVPVLDQVARTAERLRGLPRAEARARAVDGLDRLGIAEANATRLPGSMSGGELQRAALVRATLAEPDLLICDEITSGLDTVTHADLLDVLGKLQEDTGCALMVITHDLAVVAGLAHGVLLMDDGRIVEHGRTADVVALMHEEASLGSAG